MKRWGDCVVLLMTVLAACGGGGSENTATASGIGGLLRVSLTVTSGAGDDFARQNDNIGTDCGPFADAASGISLARDGKVTVRNQANAIVGVGTVGLGKLTALEEPAGTFRSQTCVIEFDVDIEGSPSFLTFDMTWTNSTATLSLTADADDINGRTLKLSKNL